MADNSVETFLGNKVCDGKYISIYIGTKNFRGYGGNCSIDRQEYDRINRIIEEKTEDRKNITESIYNYRDMEMNIFSCDGKISKNFRRYDHIADHITTIDNKEIFMVAKLITKITKDNFPMINEYHSATQRNIKKYHIAPFNILFIEEISKGEDGPNYMIELNFTNRCDKYCQTYNKLKNIINLMKFR